MHLASETDKPEDPVSPMTLLIIFSLLGICLTCLCISLGYLIMQDQDNKYDICFKSKDEDEIAMRNMMNDAEAEIEENKSRVSSALGEQAQRMNSRRDLEGFQRMNSFNH